MVWTPGPFEWLLIVLIAIILFGPKKIPELARAMGEAVKEFRKASREISEPVARRKEAGGEEDEELLLKLAEKLGVDSEGKSGRELMEEVLKKAKEQGII